MNLRSGLLRFLCLVTNGTQRHQEIPVLRDHIEKQNIIPQQIQTRNQSNLIPN
ncbi:hypothetical protein [Bathymodiolus japonicus methanotrophic gill symbiont]|uniref:hypothetical protein n=1 Tax=Bathymodiolus japonicus methanotrophic gill symbiont TaxID=113269 RepID=UPI001C8D3C12|nr:hypothetical protein [Bathymodiolus japonicus methanotrophic gill symbiont]